MTYEITVNSGIKTISKTRKTFGIVEMVREEKKWQNMFLVYRES
jgi:hypothetical protein